MASLHDIPYGPFLNIAKDLDYKGISSLCQTNKQFNKLCSDSNFWKELLRLRTGINYGGPPMRNARDFIFIEDLYLKTQIIPFKPNRKYIERRNKTGRRTGPKTETVEYYYIFELDKIEELYKNLPKFIEYLRNEEINSYFDGKPLVYYNYVTDTNSHNERYHKDLRSVFFEAHSDAGAYLKYSRNAYKSDLGLDYLIGIFYNYGIFNDAVLNIQENNEDVDLTVEDVINDHYDKIIQYILKDQVNPEETVDRRGNYLISVPPPKFI